MPGALSATAVAATVAAAVAAAVAAGPRAALGGLGCGTEVTPDALDAGGVDEVVVGRSPAVIARSASPQIGAAKPEPEAS